jgi:hypothetical protein
MKHTAWLLLACTLLAGSLVGLGDAAAFGERTQFRLAILDLDESVRSRAPGLETLSAEVRRRTSVEAAAKPVFVRLNEKNLFDHPFLILPVCNTLPLLSEADIQMLRRYLDLGGFLLVDNCQGRLKGAADQWIRAQLARIYPQRPLSPLSSDHSVFRTFYLLDRAWGRTLERADLEGIDLGDRTAVLLNSNDLLGALMRDAFGNPIYSVSDRHREMAARQGVNIVLYALTLNYKKDQIHIPFILKRRQR